MYGDTSFHGENIQQTKHESTSETHFSFLGAVGL